MPSSLNLLARWRAHPHRAVISQAFWVGLATGLYGISYGALAAAAGMNLWQVSLLSAFMFAGSAQFAFVGVIGAGGSGVAAIAASALLGSRGAFYGLQMARVLRPDGWRRLAAAHLTVDESVAVSLAQDEPRAARTGFWAAGLSVYFFWNTLSVLGAVLGNALGDPRQWGLDAAAGAAFLGLLWPRLATRRVQAVALAAAAVALVATPFLAPGIPILLAACVAVIAGWPAPHGAAHTSEEGAA